jgi:type VI secretion system protein
MEDRSSKASRMLAQTGHRKVRAGAPAVAALAVLASTGCIKMGIRPHATVAVNIAPDANQNQPVAFDFIEINDKDLAKEISKMTAADWFQKRSQIEEDFPKPNSISVRSWEWIPGQVVPDITIPMRKAPRSTLVFANYSTPGPHRAAIDTSKAESVALGRDDMTIEKLAQPKPPKPPKFKK